GEGSSVAAPRAAPRVPATEEATVAGAVLPWVAPRPEAVELPPQSVRTPRPDAASSRGAKKPRPGATSVVRARVGEPHGRSVTVAPRNVVLGPPPPPPTVDAARVRAVG